MSPLPDAEQAAAALLARSDQDHPPIDLDRILALWPRVLVSTEDLEKPGYLLDLGIHGYEIIVRSGDSLARRRFTIAHELGHIVLHAEEPTGSLSTVDASRSTTERWCDRFAASLLMPRQWIERDVAEARFDELLAKIGALPDAYCVSRQAVWLRLAEITPISLFEFQVVNNNVRASRENRATVVDADRLSAVETWLRGRVASMTDSEYIVFHRPSELHVIVRPVVSQNRHPRWFACVVPSDALPRGPKGSGRTLKLSGLQSRSRHAV